MRRKLPPHALGALALGIGIQFAPLIFHGRPIGVDGVLEQYAPWSSPGRAAPENPLLDDAATGLHPWAAALREHRELLATPSVACGAVGPAAGLFGLLAPWVLIPVFALPRSLLLTGMALADLLLAFTSFYAWRRRRGDPELPAALGACVWAYAPLRTVYRAWPYSGLVASFPLLLLAVDRELETEAGEARWPRRALVWAALTALLVLGGHPSFALMGLSLAVVYGAARVMAQSGWRGGGAATTPISDADHVTRTLVFRRLPAGLLGAALALLALSPVIALGRSFLLDGAWLAVRAPIATSPALPRRVLLLLFDPFLLGGPQPGAWRGIGWPGPDNLMEVQLYMGLATLLLVPFAVVSSRRRERWFWASVGGLTLLALVAGGPFAAAARLVPGVSIVFLARLKPVLLLCAATLAALGAEALSRHRLGARRFVLPAFLLFTIVDLSLGTLRFTPFPVRPDGPPPPTPALARLAALAPGDGHRFLGFGLAVPPNVAFDLDLEDVRSHLLHSAGYRRFLSRVDPLVFGRHGTFLTVEPETFRPDAYALDLLGVSALIAPPGTELPDGDFRLAYSGPDADVYARPWSPPARVVPRGGRDVTPSGTIRSFAAKRTRWELEIEAPAASTLLLGRSRLAPVDRVLLDGRLAQPLTDERAEGLLAVHVPEGRHRVDVDAALPAGLAAPMGTGLLGLLMLSAAALARGPRRARPDR